MVHLLTTSRSDIAGLLTSNGYNLIQDASGINSLQSTDLSGISLPSLKIDPSLQLNGSTTTKTHALLLGSPAIDAVPLPSCQIKEIYDEQSHRYTDQRGMARPGNKKTACDIGAYETQM